MNTATAAAARPFAVVIFKKGDSSRIMLAGTYATIEAAHAKAVAIRPNTGFNVAPCTLAFVAARTVVAAL